MTAGLDPYASWAVVLTVLMAATVGFVLGALVGRATAGWDYGEEGNPDDGNPDDGNPDDGNPDDGNPDDGNPDDGEGCFLDYEKERKDYYETGR